MKNYNLEVESSPGNDPVWVVRGLPSLGNAPGEGWEIEERDLPDTYLWLVGHEEACDTPESVVAGVHRALYDMYQCVDDGLQKGDTLESEPVTVNKYMSYSDEFGSFTVPGMRFRVEGVHVLCLEPK